MAIDSDPHPARALMHVAEAAAAAEERRNVAQWDMGLHRGLTRLEIASSTPPRDGAGAWASEVNQAVQAQAEQARAANQPMVRFETDTHHGPDAAVRRERERPSPHITNTPCRRRRSTIRPAR